MRKYNLRKSGLFLMLLLMLVTSCRTPVRFTYTAQNIKGDAVMNEESMMADYGKFVIMYTSLGNVSIYNKTDSIMYIDMGESYYVNNGMAQQLYSNTTTTHFSSQSRGSSVNLGSVANVLGVGGAVGALAQGINVNSGNTRGTSVETKEERYITIPPMSLQPIKSVLFEPFCSGKRKDIKAAWPDAMGGAFVNKGSYNYSAYSSPTHEYIFSYTFDPNAKYQSTRDMFYVSKIDVLKSIKKEPQKANQLIRKKEMTAGDYWKTIGTIAGVVTTVGLLIESIF